MSPSVLFVFIRPVLDTLSDTYNYLCQIQMLANVPNQTLMMRLHSFSYADMQWLQCCHCAHKCRGLCHGPGLGLGFLGCWCSCFKCFLFYFVVLSLVSSCFASCLCAHWLSTVSHYTHHCILLVCSSYSVPVHCFYLFLLFQHCSSCFPPCLVDLHFHLDLWTFTFNFWIYFTFGLPH